MEKLPMCRICLVEDVRMYVVVNKNLHELYEKLTDVPFITKDSRPMLACSFCCAKLKQCWRFQRKCLEAEELFTQLINEDHEQDPLSNRSHLEFLNGFIKTPMVHISIVGGGDTETDAIKEELPDVCEELDDIIEPEQKHQTEKLELVNVENTDVEDIVTHGAETSSEDVPLMEVKTEVVDEPEPIVKQAGRRFSQKIDLTKHDHTPAGDKSFKCNICQSSFSKKSTLKRHFRVHTGEKPFNCDRCHRSFSQKGSLTTHIRTHSGEKPFKCDICPSSFSRKSRLTSHIRTHTGEKPFKCNICLSSFSWKSSLTTHIRTHTGEKPFKCHRCHRSFSEKGSLTTHIRTHTGEKPFKCNICPSSFSRKSRLTSHIRTHTGEKPFKCNICLSSFSRKSNLTTHIRTHTGEKPFKCHRCHRSFSQKGSLTTHIRAHTGEKPFKCDMPE